MVLNKGAKIDVVNRAAGKIRDVKKQRVHPVKDRQCVVVFRITSPFVCEHVYVWLQESSLTGDQGHQGQGARL